MAAAVPALAAAELEAAPVVYEARWIRDGRGRLIADRPYNIASIAAATLSPTASALPLRTGLLPHRADISLN